MIAQQIVDVPKYIKSHKEKILKNRALEKAAATAAAAGQRAEAGGEPGPSRLKIVAPKVESEKTNRAEDEPKPGPSGLGFSSETSTAPANGNCCGDPVEPASTPIKAAEASAVASSNAP
ncbi:hypothetical protein L596_024345 [Steinernema carpocapsae]|uniref:Uncharacterized protein n=1 Tax=Steinernema carpocapsae TaxID=34508 RepID=A0A4U5MGH3_STECR|nr:hypothetical protein L596_024345 [Steinernema carpocapsae]